MTLYKYLSLYKSVHFEIPDNEVDYEVIIEWDKDYSKGFSKEYPYMVKFINKLLSITHIDYCCSNGCPIAKFSDIIKTNKDLFLEYAKKNWYEDYYNDVKDNDVELCYQFIKEFDNVAGGRYGESTNRDYYKLLCMAGKKRK